MYNNKMAVALKSAKGKILREFGETVYVPFGEEYSVFVKNLNTVRALVSISIDGTDIGDGTRFIVEPNKSIDIERFVKNGNMNEGNRLKFIERTAGVENHRGIKAEDGLVRVEFWFEKPMPVYRHNDDWYYKNPYVYGDKVDCFRGITRGIGGQYTGDTFVNQVTYTSNNVGEVQQLKSRSSVKGSSVGSTQSSVPVNDAGITVEGSISAQQFTYGSWFPVESTSHVVVLKMLGKTENAKVQTAVTTKVKAKCKTCNHLNKATAKFCSECGTSLQIV
jgi:hypothetical protein